MTTMWKRGLPWTVFWLAGCVTVPRQPPVAPVVPPVVVTRANVLVRMAPENLPVFEDDLDTASLRTAAWQSAEYFRTLPPDQVYTLAGDTYTARDFARSMDFLIAALDRSINSFDWIAELRTHFTIYQSIGTDAERSVTFSSYFEPTIPARLKPDAVFRFPLYGRPPDLIDVDAGSFDPTYEGLRLSGRRAGRSLVPYYTRQEIDSRKILRDQELELAWARSAFDVIDLQIEGSGWLDLGQGERRRIRYDGDNGRRYKSVGQHLIATGRIPAKRFSRQVFRKYLEQHPDERQKLLNVNERYIFFRIDTSSGSPYAYGNIQVPLTPGRSMASDPKLFPKGMLAWIDTTQSIVDAKDVVKGKKPLKRFMLNQDEGGAIQGPGRVDLFAGSGEDAKIFASHLWYKGKLYFLVKKNTLVPGTKPSPRNR